MEWRCWSLCSGFGCLMFEFEIGELLFDINSLRVFDFVERGKGRTKE